MLPKIGFLDTYSLCLVLGFFSAIGFVELYYRFHKLDKRLMTSLELLAVVSFVMGICSANIFQNFYDLINDPKHFSWSFNFTFYGGLIGGVITFILGYIIFIRKIYGPCFKDVVIIAPASIAIGHAFGRIGCFMHGCCYGKPTDAWYGIKFITTSTKVIPTNLFEAIILFVLAGILLFLALKKWGYFNFPIYMIVYSIWRFLIEFVRGDYRGSFIPGLSPSQFWSILLFLGGITYLVLAIIFKAKGRRLNF